MNKDWNLKIDKIHTFTKVGMLNMDIFHLCSQESFSCWKRVRLKGNILLRVVF